MDISAKLCIHIGWDHMGVHATKRFQRQHTFAKASLFRFRPQQILDRVLATSDLNYTTAVAVHRWKFE
jgi:hypothetical protein